MTAMAQEIAMPQVCLKAGEYECRLEADRVNWSRSPRLFNNATKQDRYKQMNKAYKPAAPKAPLKAAPEQLRPDLLLNAGPPRPMPVASPMVMVSGSAAQQKPVYVSGANGGAYRNIDGSYVYQQGTATSEFNYLPSDLASAMEKNQKNRAAAAGVAWNPEQAAANSGLQVNEQRSYERTAANQRANLQVNAVGPAPKQKSLFQAASDILTTPFAENSPWSPF
jgi:hypothetical protein